MRNGVRIALRIARGAFPAYWMISSILLLAAWVIPALGQSIAPPFSPESYQTIICFPDDWQKTMVNERGSLTYDFGPGPYARPLTEIGVVLMGAQLEVQNQSLEDSRVPVIVTTLRHGSDTVRVTSFSLLPTPAIPFPERSVWNRGRVRREGGMNGCIGWATPPDSVDPAFRNAAWGTNRPILYRVAVEAGSSRRVAMGICEPYKARAGMRSLELRVEGAPAQTVDPMAGGIRNTPLVVFFDGTDMNRDGWLAVECHAAGPDPNVFLNAFWVFPPGESITADQVLRGDGTRRAEIVQQCGTELEQNAPAPRADALVVELSAGSPAPQILVRTGRLLTANEHAPNSTGAETGLCLLTGTDPMAGQEPYLLSRPRPASITRNGRSWLLQYPHSTRRVEIAVVHANHGSHRLTTMPDLRKGLSAVRRYWRARAPVCAITVPDPAIQHLLETSMRTVYQVRERVDGKLQFQPGPSVYRGLWIADAMLTGIPVAMMGDTASLWRYLETGLRAQLPSGQVRSLFPSVSLVETPAWAFSAFWLTSATGDHSWIRRHWNEICRALDWICALRAQTMAGPSTPFTGLVPAGFVDGGISTPMSDYGTLWWCMVALDEGARAADMLNDSAHAHAWRSTFAGFMSSFSLAARRDILRDRYGSPFLPVGVADTVVSVPQRGQLSIFAPARFARFIDAPGSLADSLARCNLAMMEHYRSQGLYQGTGWMADGIWPWLGGYMGLIHQRIGDPERAAELLYAYADHAAPTGVWVEEQQPKGIGPATSGDVSDAEASAVFIHLVRYLLATERADGLELLGGMPARWLNPGGTIAVRHVLTEFGPLTFTLEVSDQKALLRVLPIPGQKAPGAPYLTTRALRAAGFTQRDGSPIPDRIAWRWREGFRTEFRRGMSR